MFNVQLAAVGNRNLEELNYPHFSLILLRCAVLPSYYLIKSIFVTGLLTAATVPISYANRCIPMNY